MELNLYEINEFNKEMKKLKDSLNNEDNNKIVEYAQNKKQELNEELKEINVKQIQNDGNLTAQEWLKKDFLEKEINKHEETISKIETERENNKKVILEKNLQKEDMKRQLNLQEAQVEIELADIQKKYNEAITELNGNNEQIKQLRLANRDLAEDSDEAQNNLNEILKLQNKNDELKEVMKENVITSKKGIEIKRKLEDIVAMQKILESGKILENIKNPNSPQKSNSKEPEPKKVEPVKPEPTKVEPVKPEPKKVEPIKAEPVKPEPKKVEPIKAEPVKPEPKKVEPIKAEPVKPEPKKVEPIKAEPVKPEPKKVEPIKAEPVKPVQKKVEPIKTEQEKNEKKQITTIAINPFESQIFYNYKKGKSNMEIYESEEIPFNYDHENKEGVIKVLKQYYDEEQLDDIAQSIDPNITKWLSRHSDYDINITDYLNILNGYNDNINVLYDLRDIYNSNLNRKQIKNVINIAKNASITSEGRIEVWRDPLLKRMYGNIKKRVEDFHTKLLSPGNKEDEKLNTEKTTRNNSSEGNKEFVPKAKVDENKAKNNAEAKSKENEEVMEIDTSSWFDGEEK